MEVVDGSAGLAGEEVGLERRKEKNKNPPYPPQKKIFFFSLRGKKRNENIRELYNNYVKFMSSSLLVWGVFFYIFFL